jgi:hypothetical protein
MPHAEKSVVLAACRLWLRPLISVLIRCGVTWKDFAQLTRATYVEVATTDFGKRGRPTNVSRTALLTGLSRRDVRKQREAKQTQTIQNRTSKASLVLSAWHQDPDFLTPIGTAAAIPLQGEGASFETLLRRCGAGDTRPTTLLKELEAAGAVRRMNSWVEPLMRNYIPREMDANLIQLWGKRLADLGATYLHNLTREESDPTRFERAAVNDQVPVEHLPEFRAFLEKEGQAFLEKVDEWLSAHEATREAGTADNVIRVGAGLYQLQDPDLDRSKST